MPRRSAHPVRAAVLATALAAATLGAGVITASPASAACADIDVVFARGTGEAAGPGVLGRPFIAGITSALSDRTVTSYAVDYAANSSQTSAGPGASDLTRHVTEVAASCPGTTFVLGGYSQGATVVDIALGIRTGTTSGTALPAAVADRVAAVVVFGNPLGLQRGQTIATASPTYGPRSQDYCNSSDSVCGSQPKTGTGGHLSYGSNGSVGSGVQFAAGLVRARTVPTPPAGSACVLATPASHVAADRAVAVYGSAYARGSRDYLGLVTSRTTVALRQDAPGSWSRVPTC